VQTRAISSRALHALLCSALWLPLLSHSIPLRVALLSTDANDVGDQWLNMFRRKARDSEAKERLPGWATALASDACTSAAWAAPLGEREPTSPPVVRVHAVGRFFCCALAGVPCCGCAGVSFALTAGACAIVLRTTPFSLLLSVQGGLTRTWSSMAGICCARCAACRLPPAPAAHACCTALHYAAPAPPHTTLPAHIHACHHPYAATTTTATAGQNMAGGACCGRAGGPFFSRRAVLANC